jgi:putative nucleotidyltransferase with HDIG domain
MAYSKKKILGLIGDVPAFPHSIYRILEMTTDINLSPKELVGVINHDPVLTLNILKMVNSPYFGLSQRVGTINQAVVCAGINTIKHLSLTIAPMELVTTKNTDIPELNQLLLHSLATASIARKLARKLGVSQIDSTDYYVGGLLHDVGKVALFKAIPKEYRKIYTKAGLEGKSLRKQEKKYLGLDHAQVGGLLAKKWNLPVNVRACMSKHQGTKNDKATNKLLESVQVANLIAKKMKMGFSGSTKVANRLPKKLQKRFGKDLEKLIISLGMISDEINKAQMLIQIKDQKNL